METVLEEKLVTFGGSCLNFHNQNFKNNCNGEQRIVPDSYAVLS